MIILVSPERILLDFESVALNVFRSEFPYATVTGCYIHLTKPIAGLFNYFKKGSGYKCQNFSMSGHSHKIMQM